MEFNGIEKIIQRLGGEAEESFITKAYSYLERSKGDSGMAKGGFQSKESETEFLIKFVDAEKLWFDLNLFSKYLDEGAEQKVFIDFDKLKVYKINDAIFYVNWTQYFESLFIHNLLFSLTKYSLIGFVKINETLYSVVEQEYIKPNRRTEISSIRRLMIENGFIVKKNNDYINDEYGLIIEDLHEENVLTIDDELFFIDTVIYLR